MAKIGGSLALLASIGMSVLLALSLRQVRYSGPAYNISGGVCSFYIHDPPMVSGYVAMIPKLPRTFPADLGGFNVIGTKGDSDVVFWLQLPSELSVNAVENAQVEIRHDFLDLALLGAVAGKTTVKIGSGEWRQKSWPLWGTMLGIAAAPVCLWLMVLIPSALLERRSGSRQATPQSA